MDNMEMNTNISICKVKNKENDEDLTIYAEWSDLKLKIVIAKTDQILEGEVTKENFSSYAETFEKSITEYLKETQDILAGKNEDIDFVLKNDKFFWKRKKWSLGKIDVKTLLEHSPVSSLFSDILNKFSQNIRILSEAKEKGKSDENTISELLAYNQDFIKKKEQAESEWYKRSILMINSKKAIIRNLKQNLENYESKKDPIFDADTENSESESETKSKDDIGKSKRKPRNRVSNDREPIKKNNCDISVQTEDLETIGDTKKKQSKRKPTHSLEKEDDETVKKRRSDISVQTENLVEEFSIKEKEAVASTSKSLSLPSNIGEDEETPDFLTDESECEMELQLEDDKNHDTEMQGNAITREESSEELF